MERERRRRTEPVLRARARVQRTPRLFVQGHREQVVRSCSKNLPAREDGRAAERDLACKPSDVDASAAAVLGKNWKKASDEQRKTYIGTVPKYVAKLYAIQFSDLCGPDLRGQWHQAGRRRHHHRECRDRSAEQRADQLDFTCRAAARARRSRT